MLNVQLLFNDFLLFNLKVNILLLSLLLKLMYCIFAYLMFLDCESKVCFKDSPANNGTAVVGNEPYLQYI